MTRSSLLAAVLLSLSSIALAEGSATEFKVESAVPPPAPGLSSSLPVDLPTPEQILAEKRWKEREAAAAAKAAAPAPVDPAMQGAPKVPASEAGLHGALPDAPIAGPGANFEVGQPVPVYPTMGAAAEAGVDPYRKALDAPGAAPATGPSADGFDWLDINDYLDWLAGQETNALIVLGAALALVGAGLVIGLRRQLAR